MAGWGVAASVYNHACMHVCMYDVVGGGSGWVGRGSVCI